MIDEGDIPSMSLRGPKSMRKVSTFPQSTSNNIGTVESDVFCVIRVVSITQYVVKKKQAVSSFQNFLLNFVNPFRGIREISCLKS
jgi:hypothetical protein